jgi:hypothetical protein
MAVSDVVEIPFGPDDFQTSMEDDFTLARIKKELDAVTDIEQLRKGAILLLNLAVMRQAMIRGLVKRLANFECGAIRSRIED